MSEKRRKRLLKEIDSLEKEFNKLPRFLEEKKK
jgi:hypothetical protein